MKRKSRNLLLGLVVAGLVVYFGLSFFLGVVVKAAVNRVGPKVTQTKVELAGATLSPLFGRGTLRGLAVGNPPGWSEGNAFYLGKISLSLKPFSIFGDHIVIDEIAIDQPEFSYETKVVSSNISDLLKNISSFHPGQKDKVTAEKERPKKFEIRHLILTRGKVTVGVTGAGELPLSLPTIELHNLGTAEGGITSDQVALAVMKNVSTEIVGTTAQAAGKLGSTAGAAAAEGVKKAGDELKKLWDRRK